MVGIHYSRSASKLWPQIQQTTQLSKYKHEHEAVSELTPAFMRLQHDKCALLVCAQFYITLANLFTHELKILAHRTGHSSAAGLCSQHCPLHHTQHHPVLLLTLSFRDRPPVSYTMPFPTHAMVFVAPGGVWLRMARTGGWAAALPTPYTPPKPPSLRSSPLMTVWAMPSSLATALMSWGTGVERDHSKIAAGQAICKAMQ